jgi:hypothetical protein
MRCEYRSELGPDAILERSMTLDVMAYEEGYNAYLQQKLQNPYSIGTDEYRSWAMGCQDAMADYDGEIKDEARN